MKNWSRSTKVTVGLVVILLGWAVVRAVIYRHMAHLIAHHVPTQQALDATRKLILKQKLARVFKDGTDHAKSQAIRCCQILATDMTEVDIEDHHMTMAEAASAALIDFLADLELPVRAVAADALGRMGKPAARPLVEVALNSPDKDVRTNATLALQAIGHVAVPEMIQAVKTGKPTMRVGAAKALGALGTPRAIDALIGALSAVEGDVRLTCRDALVDLGEPCVEKLIAALTNASAFTRRHSAEALGEIGDRRAAQPLLDVFTDAHRQVQLAATYAVGKVGDPIAVPPLIERLADQDRELREAAAVSLGQLADQRGVAPLTRALEDPIDKVREAAAAALGRIAPRDAAALAAIVAVSRAEDEGPRLAAVLALGLIGNPATAPAVVARLDPTTESSAKVRRRAAEALGRLGTSAGMAALVQAFSDPDWQVNYAAQAALTGLGRQAVPVLIEQLTGSDLPSRYARKALAAMPEPPLEALAAALRAPAPDVRLNATLALVEIGTEEAMNLVRETAASDSDPRVRRVAERAQPTAAAEPAVPPGTGGGPLSLPGNPMPMPAGPPPSPGE